MPPKSWKRKKKKEKKYQTILTCPFSRLKRSLHPLLPNSPDYYVFSFYFLNFFFLSCKLLFFFSRCFETVWDDHLQNTKTQTVSRELTVSDVFAESWDGMSHLLAPRSTYLHFLHLRTSTGSVRNTPQPSTGIIEDPRHSLARSSSRFLRACLGCGVWRRIRNIRKGR